MARRQSTRLLLALLAVIAIVSLATGALIGRVLDVFAASHYGGEPPPEFARLQTHLYIGLATAAVLAAVVAWLAAARLSRPLSRLKTMTHQMASGDYELEIPTLIDDDLDSIRDSLHTIAHDLKTRIATAARGRKSLEAILQSMVEGLVAVDDSMRLVLMNDVAARLLDVDAATMEGRPLADVTSSPKLLENVRNAIQSGQSTTQQMSDEDGIPGRIVEVSVSPMRDESKDIGGAVVMLQDVTAIRRLENVRRDFVANVSHELKTPLTVIQGSAETIIGNADRMPPATLQNFLRKICDNADRLTMLINDILELSRIQSGTGFLDRESLDLRNVIREITSHLFEPARIKNIEIATELPEEEVRVLGDRRALTSVVENLVANAMNYTPEGGRVAVSLAIDEGHAVFTVRDTGIGIPPDQVDRIFERFYRVDPGRSRSIGGTGLGLAIVKNCVQAHDGEIEVESEVGIGSTFVVRLPQRTEAESLA